MTAQSVITPEMRSHIGDRSEPWIVEFEPGAIRRYAEAIGDPNPLYRDPEAARASMWGGLIAPPVFTGIPVNGERSVRLDSPLVRHVTGGTTWSYARPIRAGEKLVASAVLVDLFEKQGRPGVGRMLFQVMDTTYRDLHGAVVLTTRYTDITFEGGEAEEKEKASSGKQASAPDAEATEAPPAPALAPSPPVWDDLAVGQEIEPMPKVATTQMLVRFAGASGDFSPHHYDAALGEMWFPGTGIIVHGHLKAAWLGQFVTHWIGSEGQLVRLATQDRGMDRPRHMVSHTEAEAGETWHCGGRIMGVRQEGGRARVDLQVWVENGSGHITTPGEATVALRRR